MEQKKQMHPENILIPYFLYADDFSVNNDLGSKSSNQTLCNVYYSFPTLNVKSSQLDFVFLAYVLKSIDLKNFKPNECFDELINVLYDLEVHGLDIETNQGVKNVKFILATQ